MNPTTANSTPSGLPAFQQPRFTNNSLNVQTMPLMQPSVATSVVTKPLTPLTPGPTDPQPVTQQYAPQMGPSTQNFADATYTDRITNAVATSAPVPSTAITSGGNLSTAGAKRSTYESMLQQYLDQQKADREALKQAQTPSAELMTARTEYANLTEQAKLAQEQALRSGETSAFAGGEAQRIGRTYDIKLAASAARLQMLETGRNEKVKALQDLVNSGQTDFKTQLEIQKLQNDVSGIDKQAAETFYNIAQTTGIDLPYDQTKTAVENLSAIQKERAKIQQTTAMQMTPREKASFSALVSKYREDPLVRAKDRSAGLQNTINYLVANPKSLTNGSVQYNLLYAYTQALDSYNSAVREGELRNLSGIDSMVGQVQNAFERVTSGQVLRAEQIKQIANAAQLLADSIANVGDKRQAAYGREADIVGLGEQWAQYTNESGAGNTNFGGGDISIMDKEALDAGYTQEEIDAFKQKQGFNYVGSDTNSATSQNLMGGLGSIQGLMGELPPVDYSSTDLGNMTGLMKAAPILQVAKVEIPRSSALSFVNNNPGNLRYAGQDGASKGTGGFAKFRSPEDGLNALINQIKLDASRGHTLSTFINKFAPPTENDTKLYIQQAVKTLGVTKDTPISKIPLDKLTKFVAQKESSTKIN